MDQIVGDVQVHVLGVAMHAAMPLMRRKPQRLGKALFNGFEGFRRQPGFVFRVKTDDQVIGLFFRGSRVEGLGVEHFPDSQGVIVSRPTAGAPLHEAFFWLGKICVPSHWISGSSIRACIKRQ